MVFASIFEPARSALLPNICRAEELLPANALGSVTWSFCLTVGAALGGAFTALLGRRVAFVVNSLSFLVSAILIQRIQAREPHLEAAPTASQSSSQAAGTEGLREGARYLRRHPKILVLTLAKAGLGVLGGSILLLAIFGERIFPIAGQSALAMGLLYAARGAGAGVGPLVGDHLTHGHEGRMWKSISLCFFLMGASYVALGFAPNLPLAALAIFFAHAAGSNIWVVSTSLLQMHTTDRFLGRVFSVDFGMNTLTATVSTYLVGTGLDTWRLTARQLAQILGMVMVLPGSLWLLAQAAWATKASPSDQGVVG
jgi:MFS family permease